MPTGSTTVLDRHLRPAVEEALTDTRVVVILGARQVGKSTLVKTIIADDGGARILSFDDHATRLTATQDPTGFIAELRLPVAIDEVQRVPDTLLAIKQRVDADPRPGQFLLTGSADVLTAPRIADALTGRAEYLRLWPFSQGELAGGRASFLPTLFDGEFPQLTNQAIGRSAYAAVIAAGGYPEAVRRAPARRAKFFASYLDAIIQRDLASLARVGDVANVRRLLDALAALSANELNSQALSRKLGIANDTVRGYVALLETLFLVRLLPAWGDNLLGRVIKAPKAYITDTGLLTYLIGTNARRIEADLQLGGILFETFAVTELIRQAEVEDEPLALYHYRDKEGREVDAIAERRDGAVIGIEVKAAASIQRGDFRGLAYLRDKLGDRFKAGVVLYTGAETLPFGDRLAAVPLRGLWS